MIHPRARTVLLATLATGLSGCFALLLLTPKTTAEALPDRPGKAVYVKRCGTCHSLIEPSAIRHRYQEILDRYSQQRVITNAERETLAAYLATFAPPPPDDRDLPIQGQPGETLAPPEEALSGGGGHAAPRLDPSE